MKLDAQLEGDALSEPRLKGNGSDGASPSSRDITEKAMEALECLRRAVHDEFVKKAKLGQDVIVARNGKPCKISAVEALREIDPNHEVLRNTEYEQ